jgi:hypothetical protein
MTVQELESRVRQLELTAAENRGAKNLAKWAIGVAISLSGATILGVASCIVWAFVEMHTSVAVHQAQITQHAEDIKKLDDRIDRLTDLVIKKHMVGAYTYEAKIVAITGNELVIETEEPKKRKTLKLAPDVWIIVNGKEGKPSDLKVGMSVSITEGEESQIVEIRTPTHPPLPKPGPRPGSEQP